MAGQLSRSELEALRDTSEKYLPILPERMIELIDSHLQALDELAQARGEAKHWAQVAGEEAGNADRRRNEAVREVKDKYVAQRDEARGQLTEGREAQGRREGLEEACGIVNHYAHAYQKRQITDAIRALADAGEEGQDGQ